MSADIDHLIKLVVAGRRLETTQINVLNVPVELFASDTHFSNVGLRCKIYFCVEIIARSCVHDTAVLVGIVTLVKYREIPLKLIILFFYKYNIRSPVGQI